jgi:hypothetical protein
MAKPAEGTAQRHELLGEIECLAELAVRWHCPECTSQEVLRR